MQNPVISKQQQKKKPDLTKVNVASVIRLKTTYNVNNKMLPVEIANLFGNNLLTWPTAEAQYIMT